MLVLSSNIVVEIPYSSGGITRVVGHASVSITVCYDVSYISNVEWLSVSVYFREKRYNYSAAVFDVERILSLAESGSGLNRYLNSVRQSRRSRGGGTPGTSGGGAIDLVGGVIGSISGR